MTRGNRIGALPRGHPRLVGALHPHRLSPVTHRGILAQLGSLRLDAGQFCRDPKHAVCALGRRIAQGGFVQGQGLLVAG